MTRRTASSVDGITDCIGFYIVFSVALRCAARVRRATQMHELQNTKFCLLPCPFLCLNSHIRTETVTMHVSASILVNTVAYGLGQGSATFNVKRAILAPFPPNTIHVEPQNI